MRPRGFLGPHYLLYMGESLSSLSCGPWDTEVMAVNYCTTTLGHQALLFPSASSQMHCNIMICRALGSDGLAARTSFSSTGTPQSLCLLHDPLDLFYGDSLAYLLLTPTSIGIGVKISPIACQPILESGAKYPIWFQMQTVRLTLVWRAGVCVGEKWASKEVNMRRRSLLFGAASPSSLGHVRRLENAQYPNVSGGEAKEFCQQK